MGSNYNYNISRSVYFHVIVQKMQRGGAYVGAGSAGCGFRPALRCSGEATRRAGKFSKLVNKRIAREEIQFRNMLMPIDPHQQYFLYPETICKPAPFAPEDNIAACPLALPKPKHRRVIIMGKGGRALSKFQPTHGDYPAFFDSLLNVFDGLLRLHDNGIAHNDVKSDNIVTRRRANGEYHTRLIDFGLTINGGDLEARAANREDTMYQYRVLQTKYLYWSFDMCLTDPAVLHRAAMASHSTRNDIRAYYRVVTEPRDYIPYDAFNNPRMELADVVQIAMRLLAMSIADRHRFIVTQSDILGLGLTLADTYYRLTGHADRGGADPHIQIIDNFSVRGHEEFVDPEDARVDYDAADRAWHIAVRNNISIPIYQIVRRMIDANLFMRIPLRAARAAFAMMLPRIRHYFTHANVHAHLKIGALRQSNEHPVDFWEGVAAAGRPASSSPAAAAAAVAEAEEAADVLGFAQSPLHVASPLEIPGDLAVSSSSERLAVSSPSSGARSLNTLSLSSNSSGTRRRRVRNLIHHSLRSHGISPRKTNKNRSR
jgi:serine/threonine protein kinase